MLALVPCALRSYRTSAWGLTITLESNHILMVNEYTKFWGSLWGEGAWHLFTVFLPKAFHGPYGHQTPTLPAGSASSKLQELIEWKRKCLLLMEWEINALIFFLHLRRQNENTDERCDAEKQISSASEMQDWMFQLQWKVFKRLYIKRTENNPGPQLPNYPNDNLQILCSVQVSSTSQQYNP